MNYKASGCIECRNRMAVVSQRLHCQQTKHIISLVADTKKNMLLIIRLRLKNRLRRFVQNLRRIVRKYYHTALKIRKFHQHSYGFQIPPEPFPNTWPIFQTAQKSNFGKSFFDQVLRNLITEMDDMQYESLYGLAAKDNERLKIRSP